MPTADDLKTLFKKYNFFPSKGMGQNFLTDSRTAVRIVEQLALRPGEKVLEIGPGFGALTEHLIASGVHVIAIERDRRLAHALKDRWGAHSHFQIVTQDFLQWDWQVPEWDGPFVVLGNLPYVITSPVLEKLVLHRKQVRRAVVTVQQEVAERVAASPGGKTFGSLTCFVQAFYAVEILFDISPKAFYPQPAVSSSVIRLTPRAVPAVAEDELEPYVAMLQALFQRRRKTVVNGLLNPVLGLQRPDAERIIQQAAIDPTARPETLSIEQFAALARLWKP